MTLVSPEYSVEIAGQKFVLSGGISALKAIQHAMEHEIHAFIIQRVPRLSFEDSAQLLTIGIKEAGGTPPTSAVIEQAIVDDIGIEDVRTLIFKWLTIATSRKPDREKKARELEELFAVSRRSPGRTTNPSA